MDPKFGMYAQAIIQSVNAHFIFLLLNPKRDCFYKFFSNRNRCRIWTSLLRRKIFCGVFKINSTDAIFFGILSFYLYTGRDTKLKL